MKKFLLLAAAIMAFCIPSANAITVDDLDGKLCLQFFYGNNAQDMLGVSTCSGFFQKISNNKVVVRDFKGHYNVEFTLSNNKLSSPTVFYQRPNYYNYTWYSDDESRYIMFNKVKGYTSNINGYPASGYAIYNDDQSLTSAAYATIKTGLNGFAFIPESGANTRPVAIEEYYEVGDQLIDEWVYHGFYLFVVEPNALALRDGSEKSYLLRYEKDGKTVNVQNFNNFGIKYTNNYSRGEKTVEPYISFDVANDGSFTIPGQAVGGFPYAAYYGYRTVSNVKGYWFGTEYQGHDDYYLGSAINRGDISGRYYNDNIAHHGFTKNNNWAYDENLKGSHLHTLVGEVFECDNIVYYDNLEEEVVSQSNKTIIHGLDADITHKVTLNLSRYGYGPIGETGEDWMYAEGFVTPGANADYVESYEIYAVPGSYSNVTEASFNDTENGNTKGIALNDYMINWRPAPNQIASRSAETESFKGGDFAVLVPATDLASTTKNYTFYVKTNYITASGLEPTFHALARPTPDITTGIDDVLNLDNDNDAPVIYYNMNGVQVDGDNLTPGLYIRRQGNTATKVIIK